MATAKPKANPRAALDAVFAKSKKDGLNVGPLGSVIEDTLWLPTGNLSIDNAFGGGIPLGRSIELYGPTSCGKTTLATQAAVALQKIIIAGGDPALGIGPDDVILYLDYEQTMDIQYAIALGLDPEHDSFQISQPDTLEQGADLVMKAVKTGFIRLVVVDSVAAMVPSAQAEADSVGKALPAITARIMKTFGQNLNPVLKNHNASVIWINHEVEVMAMGGRPGMPPSTSTPGGKALKYFASVRAQFRPIKHHKGPWTDALTGEVLEINMASDIRLKIVKNKVATPFREAVLRVRYGRGFDNFWTAMQILLANKQVMYGEQRFRFHNIADQGGAPDWMPREATGTKRPSIHGEKALFKAADKHHEWRQLIIDIATEVAHRNLDALELVVRNGVEEADDDEDDEPEETVEELDDILGGGTSAGARVKI
jgi:recombination protein RecA